MPTPRWADRLWVSIPHRRGSHQRLGADVAALHDAERREHPVLEALRSRARPIEEVLVEGPSRKDEGVLTGRTRQNKLVHFAAATPVRPGSYATVRVTGAAPHHLVGELVAVTDVARHRTRIPVAAG